MKLDPFTTICAIPSENDPGVMEVMMGMGLRTETL
jgi:hypothetical protein